MAAARKGRDTIPHDFFPGQSMASPSPSRPRTSKASPSGFHVAALFSAFTVTVTLLAWRCGYNGPWQGSEQLAGAPTLMGDGPLISVALTEPILKDEGVVGGLGDGCRASATQLQFVNVECVQARLEALVESDFFRYYRVDLDTPCMLDGIHGGLCFNPSCVLEPCDQAAIDGNVVNDTLEVYRGRCLDLSGVDRLVNRTALECLVRDDEEQFGYCPPEVWSSSRESAVSEVFDLLRNPERHTGYEGQEVWPQIYDQNCFVEPVNSLSASLCLEQRFFFRMLSGMHTSVSVHLCQQWYDAWTDTFKKNPVEFARRFEEHPEWIENLYFVYALVLRAVVKAEQIWTDYPFSNGDPAIKAGVLSLVKEAAPTANLFDETLLFAGAGSAVKAGFRNRFRSISQILACVGCEKCRLWSKLQVQGLGTALKVLFEHPISLKRSEIVALFNTLRQFSAGLSYVMSMMN